jgi:hypothetical protein
MPVWPTPESGITIGIDMTVSSSIAESRPTGATCFPDLVEKLAGVLQRWGSPIAGNGVDHHCSLGAMTVFAKRSVPATSNRLETYPQVDDSRSLRPSERHSSSRSNRGPKLDDRRREMRMIKDLLAAGRIPTLPIA